MCCQLSMVTWGLLVVAVVFATTLETVKGKCIKVDPKEVCYDNYIKFYMFTRDGILQLGFNQAAPFVVGIPTILLLHDTGGNITSFPVLQMARGYLNRKPMNVLGVDYSPLTGPACPKESAANVPYIGHCISHFITELREVASVELTDVHVVGFGIGAQVAALSSFYLQKPLGRITGLDPAYVGFAESVNVSHRLDNGDSMFVDVIHTNKGVMGIPYLAGHADYFVSNGSVASGCESLNTVERNICSHLRAAEYFLESIYSSQPTFYATPCSPGSEKKGNILQSYKELQPRAVMGEQASRWSNGVFCVPVNAEYPYGRGPPSS